MKKRILIVNEDEELATVQQKRLESPCTESLLALSVQNSITMK